MDRVTVELGGRFDARECPMLERFQINAGSLASLSAGHNVVAWS